MKYYKLIKKWAKLRHPDPKFGDTAIKLYESLEKYEKEAMLKEFTEYIEAVEDGIIDPSPVALPEIPKV